MGMGTVAETAVTSDLEDLSEIMTDLFFLKINRAETFNAWRINDTSIWQEVHFREGSGVHTFVMGIGDFARARHLASKQCIEQGAFADTGVAG